MDEVEVLGPLGVGMGVPRLVTPFAGSWLKATTDPTVTPEQASTRQKGTVRPLNPEPASDSRPPSPSPPSSCLVIVTQSGNPRCYIRGHCVVRPPWDHSSPRCPTASHSRPCVREDVTFL